MSTLNRYFQIMMITCMFISSSVFAINNKNADQLFGPPIHTILKIAPKNQPSYIIKDNFAPQTAVNASLTQPQKTKSITLLNFRLNSSQKKNLSASYTTMFPKNQVKNINQSNNSNLPSKIDLGMNNVPVLDQGELGTCTTFATFAAYEALLNKGELISPLCFLQLGSYLARKGYGPSGWDGSIAPIVLARFQEFGYMTMSTQRAKSCGKLTEYPTIGTDTGYEMSLDDYHRDSNDTGYFAWHSLLTIEQRFNGDPQAVPALMDRVLNETKQALADSNKDISVRIISGILLPYRYCNQQGLCGTNHVKSDSWVLTKQMASDLTNSPDTFFLGVGGHNIVITGYDDDAVVKDEDGTIHRGIFIMRNSWGKEAGDQGNFYMTYDFFKLFSDEVVVVKYFNNVA